FFAKNISSSPITPIRLTTLSVNRIRSFSFTGTGLSGLLNNAVTQHQTVHTTPRKSTECFGRRVDDRLTFEIERRVQHQRDAGCLSESLNQPMIFRADVPVDRLQPTRAVDVRYGRDDFPLVLVHMHDIKHETRWVMLHRVLQIEKLFGALGQNGRRKGPERLAKLDLYIDKIFHVGAPGVGQNASMPQGTRAPFKPSVKP